MFSLVVVAEGSIHKQPTRCAKGCVLRSGSGLGCFLVVEIVTSSMVVHFSRILVLPLGRELADKPKQRKTWLHPEQLRHNGRNNKTTHLKQSID